MVSGVGAVPPAGPGAGDHLSVVSIRGAVSAGLAGRARNFPGPGRGIWVRDIGRDIGVPLRRYVQVRSRWDKTVRYSNERHPSELAALTDHVIVDPGGRAHLGEPVRRGRTGQGVAAAFGGGHPGDLGVVDQVGRLADADHAPALDPRVPFDPGGEPNVIRHSEDV